MSNNNTSKQTKKKKKVRSRRKKSHVKAKLRKLKDKPEIVMERIIKTVNIIISFKKILKYGIQYAR